MADCVQSVEAGRLQDWLIEAGVAGLPADELLEGFCRRLVGAGFPLSRAFVSFATLHPLHRARSATWREGAVETAEFDYDEMPEAPWQGSPFRHMMETRTPRLHRRLT